MSKTIIGNNNLKAREAAVTALANFKGKTIKSLKADEVKELLAIVMQLLGLADQDGNIK